MTSDELKLVVFDSVLRDPRVGVVTHEITAEKAYDVVESALRAFEERAIHRAIAAFVGTDPKLRQYYTSRTAFKVTVDSFAQIMVAGVFGNAPLSEAEVNKRIEMVNAVPVVFPQGL